LSANSGRARKVVFRADAAFTKPELYQAPGRVGCEVRALPSNHIVEGYVVEFLTPPVGRPGYQTVVRYKSFSLSADQLV
jgi:hypothetical protein